MMKFIKAAFLFVLAISTAHAQYDPEAKAILDDMSQRYKAIPAFSADFTQTLVNEAAGLNETMQGEIMVMDNMYRLDIAGQEIYNDGTDVWSYNPEINEVTVSTYDPEEAEISLGNIWDLYKEGFKYTLLAANEKGKQVIDLNPEDRSKSYYKIRMFINPDNTLDSFTVFESSGNKYTYSISNFKEEAVSRGKSAFTFDPTSKDPEPEVIDFRN